jgi:uncharacterized protein (DUF1778 family)
MANKTERIEMRVSPEHKALIERAAALRGQSISAFVVAEVLERARQIDVSMLSKRDWEEFIRILDADDEPTPALRAAAQEYRKGR